jgi:hypothetical protein
MKSNFIMRIILFLLPSLVFYMPQSKAGIPCTHILICCRESNKGIKFSVNGKWNEAHDYSDRRQVSDVLQKIKDAGIRIVIIDMTNDSQWNQYWKIYKPMVENIQQVCKEKKMQFVIFIGAAGSFADWNEKAKIIWTTWAKDSTYRRYGFGDNRPMLVAFQPSDMYWERYNKAPESEKTYLSKFHIGTTQVNDPILPGKSDGWGYRNYSQSVDGKVRFVCPNGAVVNDTWHRIDGNQWRRRIEWARKSLEYSVYGSYDDTCDAINWGIADTKDTEVKYNKYPGNDPFIYYDILKKELTGLVSE